MGTKEQQLYDQDGNQVSLKTRAETVYFDDGRRLSDLDVTKVYDRTFNLSNPNLILNPDFKINQRNQTTYNKSGFAVDRWYFLNTNSASANVGDFVISQDSIHMTGADDKNLTMYQKIEGLPSGKYTFSANIKLDGVTSGGVNMWVNAPDGSTTIGKAISIKDGITSITFEVTDAISTGMFYFCIGSVSGNVGGAKTTIVNPKAKIIVYWAKLEVGELQTPFSPPDYTIELLKCRRYFYKPVYTYPGAVDAVISRVYVVTANTLIARFVFPVPMRATPTVKRDTTMDNVASPTQGLYLVNIAKSEQRDFAITVACNRLCCDITFTRNRHGLTDASIVIGAGSNFQIDAEIY